VLGEEDGSVSRDCGRVDATEHSLADSDLHSLDSQLRGVGLRYSARNIDWHTVVKTCKGAHGYAQTDLLDPRLHAHMKMVSRTIEEPGREPLLHRAADAVLLQRWYVSRVVSCGE